MSSESTHKCEKGENKVYVPMKRRMIILTLLTLALLQVACLVNYRHLRPVGSEEPVMLLGKYYLDIGSVNSTGGPLSVHSWMYGLDCDVIYRGELPDNTNYDTIPVFVMDSICFAGECLNENFCVGFPVSTNASTIRGTIRDSLSVYDSTGHEDLPFRRYSYTGDLGMPKACDGGEVLIGLYARLLDRVTFAEIARESKVVRFQMSKRRSSHF